MITLSSSAVEAMAKSRRWSSPLWRQSFVTAAVCINIVGQGCSMGYPAILLPQLTAPGSTIPLDQESNSWLASIMMLPVLAGCLLMPSLMDRLGRRNSHVLVILPTLAGWVLVVVADSFLTLTISRIFQGLSFGLNLPLRSVLIGEYTSPKYRGAFLMLVSLAQAAGIFAVHATGTFLHWQTTGLLCLFFPFISLVMTLYTPESPCYLADKGKMDECQRVFRWLRGDGEENELEEMIAVQEESVEGTSSCKEVIKTLKKKEFYKPVLIMVHANAVMQFCGGATMAVYSTLIISLIVGPEANPYFWMIFLDAQRIVFNFLAVYVINKYKRRTMLFSMGGLCVASHIAIAGYVFARNSGFLSYDAVWIPIMLINLQFFTVATGMVPLPNVIAGEVFPFEFRAVGGSISVVSATMICFVILKSFSGLATSIGIEGIYLIYSLIMIYLLTVIWFTLPETKGKTLQEIEDNFRGVVRQPYLRRETDPLQEPRRKVGNRKMSAISNHSLVLDI